MVYCYQIFNRRIFAIFASLIFSIPVYSSAATSGPLCTYVFDNSETNKIDSLSLNTQIKEYESLLASNKRIEQPKTSEQWLALIEAKSSLGSRKAFSFSEFLSTASPKSKKKLFDIIHDLNEQTSWSEYRVKKIATKIYKLTHYKSFSWLEAIGFRVPDLSATIIRHLENQIASQNLVEMMSSFGKISSPDSIFQKFQKWYEHHQEKLAYGLAITYSIISVSQTSIPSSSPLSKTELNKLSSRLNIQVIKDNGFDRLCAH